MGSAELGAVISVVFTLVGVCGSFAAVLVGFAVMAFVLSRVVKGLSAANARPATARSAPATVVSVADTGVTLNDNPQVRVTVQLHPEGAAAYQASFSMFVSRVQTAQFQPGSLLDVWYDAANPQKIGLVRALGSVEAYAPDGGVKPDVLEVVRAMITSQALTEALASAPEQPATVVACRELGLYCGGRNPFVELLVEVRPVDGSPFAATATGVVAQLSVGKYAAGNQVFVRVDPANRERVALSRSA